MERDPILGAGDQTPLLDLDSDRVCDELCRTHPFTVDKDPWESLFPHIEKMAKFLRLRRTSPRAALSWTVVRSYRSWMFSRRHIDLLRVAGALCPAYGDAATRHTVPPRTAL
ncbi:putative leader peptide [Streptomyces niveus]|uniref:putative leader peptide n=1 Tax=Streptomyces niveus TaxID=193462 RepID=UPI0003C576BB|nr:putative leader peptide [Streptomyces niveus]EST31170.1 hypothetical protein M877_07810 [Streptomyces niveus NCIMB 11891]